MLYALRVVDKCQPPSLIRAQELYRDVNDLEVLGQAYVGRLVAMIDSCTDALK